MKVLVPLITLICHFTLIASEKHWDNGLDFGEWKDITEMLLP